MPHSGLCSGGDLGSAFHCFDCPPYRIVDGSIGFDSENARSGKVEQSEGDFITRPAHYLGPASQGIEGCFDRLFSVDAAIGMAVGVSWRCLGKPVGVPPPFATVTKRREPMPSVTGADRHVSLHFQVGPVHA